MPCRLKAAGEISRVAGKLCTPSKNYANCRRVGGREMGLPVTESKPSSTRVRRSTRRCKAGPWDAWSCQFSVIGDRDRVQCPSDACNRVEENIALIIADQRLRSPAFLRGDPRPFPSHRRPQTVPALVPSGDVPETIGRRQPRPGGVSQVANCQKNSVYCPGDLSGRFRSLKLVTQIIQRFARHVFLTTPRWSLCRHWSRPSAMAASVS